MGETTRQPGEYEPEIMDEKTDTGMDPIQPSDAENSENIADPADIQDGHDDAPESVAPARGPMATEQMPTINADNIGSIIAGMSPDELANFMDNNPDAAAAILGEALKRTGGTITAPNAASTLSSPKNIQPSAPKTPPTISNQGKNPGVVDSKPAFTVNVPGARPSGEADSGSQLPSVPAATAGTRSKLGYILAGVLGGVALTGGAAKYLIDHNKPQFQGEFNVQPPSTASAKPSEKVAESEKDAYFRGLKERGIEVTASSFPTGTASRYMSALRMYRTAETAWEWKDPIAARMEIERKKKEKGFVPDPNAQNIVATSITLAIKVPPKYTDHIRFAVNQPDSEEEIQDPKFPNDPEKKIKRKGWTDPKDSTIHHYTWYCKDAGNTAERGIGVVIKENANGTGTNLTTIDGFVIPRCPKK